MPVTFCGILLFLLLCLSASGSDRTIAQFVHKAWTGKDGAPANITAITQTNDGYLWLASSQGLYRFDGVEFERFEPSGQAMPSRGAFSLLSCPNGDLWVGFREAGGIGLLRNGINRNFTGADGLPEGGVQSLTQDRSGAIWAATRNGLARFDGEKWRKVGPESGFEGRPVGLYVDPSGTLWASSLETIFSLPPGAESFHRTGIRTGWVTHMQQSPSGTLWLAETTRAVRPIPTAAKGPEIVLGSQNILFDRDGSLWITTVGDGLRRFANPDRLTHGKIEKSSRRLESFTAKNGLSADYATSIFQDREGNIWVGTSGGVDRFTKGALIPAPISGKLVRTTIVPGDRGDVWLGSGSPEVGRIRNNEWIPGATHFAAFSAVHDPNGGTWWSTFKSGYREINGRFTRFDFPRPYLTNNLQPTVIALDRSGALWLSGSLGLFVRRGGDWEAVDPPASFPGRNGTVAYADAAGRLWFGYRENAILVIDGSIPRVLTSHDGLRVGIVQAISVRGSWTWIAGSQGLQSLDGQGLRDISPIEGGSFGSVSGVDEASDGSLWLNAYRGIIRIAPAAVSKVKAGAGSAEYSVFGTYDGLPGPPEQGQPYPTLIQAPDGNLWFGTGGGPVRLNPKHLPTNGVRPTVVVRSLTAHGKRYASFADLRLPALTRDLAIGYTALSFTVPERVRYRYKLEGSDKDWQEAGTRRQAFYTNLGPGGYRFRLTACNNDGVWNEEGTEVNFRILPAWYQTIWFQAVCYAAGVTLLWFLYRFRLQQVTVQIHSRLEGRISERDRIARELHDTLLQSFQGLMLRLQAVEELLPPGKAKEQLEQSLKRADQAIAEGRRAVHDLRSATMAGNDLVEALRVAANELVGDGAPTFRLVVEGASRDLHPILRDELYRIACEALRNAFKHARAHHVEAEITYGERLFQIRIRDDGDGIPPHIVESGRSGHYGLTGMRERAQQSGASLDIWSGAGIGTEVNLSVPGSLAYSKFRKRSAWRLFTRKAESGRDSSTLRR